MRIGRHDKNFFKTALGLAALSVCALPASASSFVSFNAGNNGTYSSATGQGTIFISSITEQEGNYIKTFSLPNYILVNFTAGASPVLTLTTQNATGLAGIGNGVSLLSGTTGLAVTQSNANPPIIAASLTSTSFIGTFLADLGYTAGTSFTLSSGAGFNGLTAGTISSDTLQFQTSANFATPEPGSVFLIGAGLVALGLMNRKRFLRSL